MNSLEKRRRKRLLRNIPKSAYDALTAWAKTAQPGDVCRWQYRALDGTVIEIDLTREQVQRMEPVK